MKFPTSYDTDIVAKPTTALEDVKSRLEEYREAVEEMQQQASLHVVKDEVTAKQAVSMASSVKTLSKKIDNARKEAIEEPQTFIKTVNGMAKSFTDRLSQIETALKKRLADYQYTLELARREQERKAREEAEKLQQALNKEAKDLGVEPVKVVAPVLPKPEKVTRSEDGASAHIRKAWKCEVVNPEEVPRQFCSPDSKKLNDAVKAGLREIPGCHIYEEATAIIR
jgi:hypothetical protein